MSTSAPSAPPPASVPGRFGPFGGRYVSETLIPSLDELTAAWAAASADPAYAEELSRLLTDYVGARRRWASRRACRRTSRRRSARTCASTSSARTSATRARTRSTTASARCCWRARMGKTRIIAETGAGQHGVATATACALFGLPCEVYMGASTSSARA
jgi:tryptophan synthase beta chain